MTIFYHHESLLPEDPEWDEASRTRELPDSGRDVCFGPWSAPGDHNDGASTKKAI
ncbi:MAG: hypothetical protein WD342_09295 [Verrucomicrobiales bacterium]